MMDFLPRTPQDWQAIICSAGFVVLVIGLIAWLIICRMERRKIPRPAWLKKRKK